MNYKSRIFLGTSLLLGSLFIFSTDVNSTNSSNYYDEQALEQIEKEEKLAESEGFSPDNYQVIRLSPRRQVNTQINDRMDQDAPIKSQLLDDFVPPGKYAIFAGCDQNCSEVELIATDASEKELFHLGKKPSEEENSPSEGKKSARILITEITSKTKPYQIRLRVKCNTSKAEACYAYSKIWQKIN